MSLRPLDLPSSSQPSQAIGNLLSAGCPSADRTSFMLSEKIPSDDNFQRISNISEHPHWQDAPNVPAGSYISFSLDVNRIAAQYDETDPVTHAINTFRAATTQERYVGLVVWESAAHFGVDGRACREVYVTPVSMKTPEVDTEWIPIEPIGPTNSATVNEPLNTPAMFPWVGCIQLLGNGIWLNVAQCHPCSLDFRLDPNDSLRVLDSNQILSLLHDQDSSLKEVIPAMVTLS
jgi:hypothetical protein